MNTKDILIERQNGLIAQVETALADETRSLGDGDVAEMIKGIKAIKSKLDALDEMCSLRDEDIEEGDEEEEEDKEGGDEEGNGPRRSKPKVTHPAIHRSRGSRSQPDDINAHATREKFSVSRAIDRISRGRQLQGIEAEVDTELRRSQKGPDMGFLLPLGDMARLNQTPHQRDLTLSTGAGAVATIWDAANFVDYLYPLLVGPLLGFDYISGLTNITKLPRQSAAVAVAGVAEGSAPSASAPSIDNVTFTPSTLATFVPITRKFEMQSVVDADRYVLKAIASQMAVQMDYYAIAGTGANNTPTGLLNNSGLTQFQYATSNLVAYKDIVALEKFIAAANAYFGPNLGWLTSPTGYAALQSTAKIGTTFPIFLVGEDGNMIGHKCVRSSQVPTNLSYCGTGSLTALAFGNWSYLTCATFGAGLEIIVDPFTQSTSGTTVITGLMDYDTQLLHPQAFAVVPNFTGG